MKARKLLSITGAVAISFVGGAAAATGNLMPPPRQPPPVDKVADAGTAAQTPVPLQKKEAKKDGAKQ
ncbi:MAG: hypothetical protein H6Q89_1825 [Myxococcaceae bacterium]|nr:hypothetical protein [Myxococcaceae bacterium]